jgi:DNA-binding NarL/FixJ family response regulator
VHAQELARGPFAGYFPLEEGLHANCNATPSLGLQRVGGETVSVSHGRAAYARNAWQEAFEALSAADRESPLAAEDLERLAWSAGLAGHDVEQIGVLERVYQRHLDDEHPVAAARAAFWAGFRLFSLGEPGRASAWLARAERLVEHEDETCAVRGYLLLPPAHRLVAAGQADQARAAALRSLAIGEAANDPDLVALARTVLGRTRILEGDHARALRELDEAMLAATRGALSIAVTGIVYCTVIECCHAIYAVERAREWTEGLTAWCESQPELQAFAGPCRVHRSLVLELKGAWDAALAEAEQASTRLGTTPNERGAAFYQKAEIHRLRGEHDAAEAAYLEANRCGREPQPGMALLRLAQGRADAASASIRRVLESVKGDLARARYLPAAVEVFLADGNPDDARRAARELADIASGKGNEILDAMAAHARGAVHLASGEAREAIEPLRHAFAVWQRAGAPYLAAKIRVLLGMADRASGDEDGARMELEAAQSVFRNLGAPRDLERVRASLAERQTERPFGLTAREIEVLRLVARGKTNKAIAHELFLSEKTIDRHVSNIFDKIGVPSRAAATAFAFEHRLL